MQKPLKCRLAFLLTLIFFSFARSQDMAMAMIPNVVDLNSESSIIKSAQKSGIHTILVKAIKAAKLEEILDNDGSFTFFAPSDNAFEKFSKEKIQFLIDSKNTKELRSLLTYHIVARSFSASKILKAMCRGEGVATFTTLQGTKLTASMNGSDIVLTDSFGNNATIVKADANQCNGVIHVIDNVIRPQKKLPQLRP